MRLTPSTVTRCVLPAVAAWFFVAGASMTNEVAHRPPTRPGKTAWVLVSAYSAYSEGTASQTSPPMPTFQDCKAFQSSVQAAEAEENPQGPYAFSQCVPFRRATP